ncbi:hypothetical protein [Humitalea rosea]|nr:hypothetical protein [Humitalea rosea]
MSKTKTPVAPAATTMTAAQRAYETKRAQKAGVSLEKWLAAKQADRAAEAKATAAPAPAAPPKKPGFLGRLMERVQKPI